MVIIKYNCFPTEPLWRNWLARSAVTETTRCLKERNRKAGGSSPPRGDAHFF